MSVLPPPPVDGPVAVAEWVSEHLGDLACEGGSGVRPSARIRGGQSAADAALAAFDVSGYAARRNEVLPRSRRGASVLSPYIRHGLLTLQEVWDRASGPSRDVAKFRDELLWQEYARHLYARIGARTADDLRFVVPVWDGAEDPWDRSMACVAATLSELEDDGWMVNQTRMWMASQWSVRHGAAWQEGEDRFFRHLLDGSRAANRLGWQWTVGAGTGKAYGFSRWQVEKRAPELCRSCAHRSRCPIQNWPDEAHPLPVTADPRLRHDANPERTAGPSDAPRSGAADAVWLTAESLGAGDPALAANPALPAVFVWDERLLRALMLSGKRLVFIAEALAELGVTHPGGLEVHRGDPAVLLAGRALATTFAPVPGWRRLAGHLQPVEVHPWPWLRRPGAGPLTSYTAWVRSLTSPG